MRIGGATGRTDPAPRSPLRYQNRLRKPITLFVLGLLAHFDTLLLPRRRSYARTNEAQRDRVDSRIASPLTVIVMSVVPPSAATGAAAAACAPAARNIGTGRT